MKRVVSIIMALCLLFGLCACGKEENKGTGEKDSLGRSVWYFGGNSISSGAKDPKSFFEGVNDTINPKDIYRSIILDEKMLQGVYTIENNEKALDEFKKQVPFVDFKSGSNTTKITALPISVVFGNRYICDGETGYDFGDFKNFTELDIAALRFATEDKKTIGLFTYKIEGSKLKFTAIKQTSQPEEKLTYEILDDKTFEFDFSLAGVNLTLQTNGTSYTLKSYSFTEKNEHGLWLSAYSLENSPLVEYL